MLPSSSSHVARYGQINHYKKFWLLQTQLEKQEQPSTALSLGVTGSANVKESAKPLISSNTLLPNGDHLSNSTAGHGSCRVDMVSSAPSTSSSRAGPNFPYCSNEPASTSKLYSNGRLGYTHNVQSNGSLRRDSSPLSLAVNCEGVTHPNINFLNQSWAPTVPTSCAGPASELQLRNSRSPVPRALTSCISLVKESSCGEAWESSECSSDQRGEKRGQLTTAWETNVSTSPSTSSFSLSGKKQQQHELVAGSQGQFSSSIIIPSSLQEAASLPSSSRSGLGCAGPLRICTLCGTTKTPLWRSGPEGPKSLCNACGIRVKKTKRLQAAMEAAGEGAEKIIRSASSPAGAYKRLLAAAAAAAATTSKAGAAGRAGTTSHKRKLSMEAAENQSDPFFQLKKKKKKAADRRSGCCSWPLPNVAGVDSGTCYRVFGESPANLAAHSGSSKKFSNLFAKDVEEAAVLLMALSCGLVLS